MTRRVFFHLPVFAFLVWAAPLFANSAGIPGYSGKNGPLVICNVCHGGGATPIVSLTGPATLNPNGTGTFTFTVQSADRDIQVAAGIGIYGAALSFYDLWLARGHDVVFPKDTRVEITTTSSRSPLKASTVKQKPAPSP